MKILRLKTVAVAALLLSSSVASGALPADVPAIRPDHPRLFFNRDTWPAVKARAFGPARPALDRLLSVCDGYPDNPKCSGTEPAPPGWSSATPLPPVREWGLQSARCALAWRFTGKPEYLEKAKRMLAVNVAAYAEALRNRRAVSWYSTTRILSLCAYDWIFEALTPEERRSIIVPLVRHAEDVQARPGRPAVVRRNPGAPDTGFYGVLAMLWYSGVAAAGDGFCDDLARRHLEEGYGLMLKMLKYRENVSGDDGPLASGVVGYSVGQYPWAHFNFFHTLFSAAGVDAAGEYPGLALFPNWIWWNWIQSPAGPSHFGFGDTRHAKNIMRIELLYEHMTQYAHFYRKSSPEAARLAMSLRERAPNRNIGTEWPMYPFILSGVDDVRPYSDRELDEFPLRARHFESVGQFVMRSGWSPDATYCMFTSGGPVTMHRHYDENNFVIYRKGFQALDSGSRALQTDHNLTYYYAQTVAHNCVLIHRPGEPLTSYWGLKYKGPEGRHSYGGQGHAKGTPLAFETNRRYTYVASDATKSYGPKCREAVRQFVWISPDVFIVYDRVTSTDPSYSKEWLLHTANEPVIDGNLVRASAEGGAICSRTLLPEKADIGKTGGPGREYWASGKNWELDPKYVEQALRECRKAKTGPWFGRWRVEVKPPEAAASDRFLHVINVSEAQDGRPVTGVLVREGDLEGARVSVPGCLADGVRGTLEATVLFNRGGPVGGRIRLRTIGDDGIGRIVAERALSDRVEPQSGVFSR